MNIVRRPPLNHSDQRERRASATVELAVCLPVIVLLVFGGVEASHMIFLRQTMTQAAYAGARIAARNDSTNADVESVAQSVLTLRNIQGASISVSPEATEERARGENLTVTVSAPCNANSAGPSWFFRNQSLTTTVTMVKE